MSVHDWTRVEAGIFHSFHNAWIVHLAEALNGGLLPPDYYALGEQHAGRFVTDLLTLHTSRANDEPPLAPSAGGLALADSHRKFVAANGDRDVPPAPADARYPPH